MQSIKAAAAELCQREYYDITLISEPYSTKGRVRLEVKNGAIICWQYKGRVNSAKGMSYLPSWQMDDNANRDTASAIIRSDEGDFCPRY